MNNGDWPEDFRHENGNYSCLCCECGSRFTGHKRRVVCKVCDEEKRVCVAPTLSPEAQAVLERLDFWLRSGGDAHLARCRNNEGAGCSLCDLVHTTRAWQATQKPKDYAPDELEPGTRFTFAVGGAEGAMVQMFGHTWRYWLDTSGYLHKFQEGQRLIPLPEQDG